MTPCLFLSLTAFLVMLPHVRERGKEEGKGLGKEGGLMESILLWTGQNDQLQVMRMDHAGKKIAARERE